MESLEEKTFEFKKPEVLASIVKRLGNPVSTTLLHSPCSVFQIPQVDGAIGYHQVGNCVVAVGDPICLPQDMAKLAHAFHRYCQEHHLKTVYLLAYDDFSKWAINNGCRTLIEAGKELSINPTHFRKKQKLQWKINQSIQHDVHIKEYKKFDSFLENQIHNTIQTWLKNRSGPQIYLGPINLFNSDVKKRIFYAQQNGKIIGVLIIIPIDRLHGWVVSSYLALLDAPVGTTEHLICSTIDALANENCHFLCIGASTGKLGEIIGLGPFGKILTHFLFKMARWFFKLDSKERYLNKYHPSYRSTFLLSRDKLNIAEVLALKHVLNVKL